ncbi:trypsin-like serine protease, partial [Candidatus Woesearchaeota archaeon]|nr:trypsin-like serine protease [Candidatus Woesearchaeota archaeon]
MVSYTRSLESLLALRLSLAGDWDLTLSPAESRRNIRDNVVRLVDSKNGTSGSGLRLTTDGYIVTAHHVFENWEEDWNELLLTKPRRNIYRWQERIGEDYYVQVDETISYPLDISFCHYFQLFDIGLLKARIPEKPKPIRYIMDTGLQYVTNTGSPWSLCEGQKITGFFRSEEGKRLPPRRGHVTTIKNVDEFSNVKGNNGFQFKIYEPFLSTLNVRPGDSGSPVALENGVLVGLVAYRKYLEAGCTKI